MKHTRSVIPNVIQKKPLLSSVLFSLILGCLCSLPYLLVGMLESPSSPTEWLACFLEELLAFPFVSVFLGAFLIYPLVLTAVNLVLLFAPAKYPSLRRAAKSFEVVTLILGSLYGALIQAILNICWQDDWQETLHNSQVHAPIHTQAWPTVLTFLLAGLAGYLALSFIRLEKLPPLAEKIRSRQAADAVYLLMKPLEWFFLAVLYLCDAKPENRIAIQYLPRAAVEAAQKSGFAAAQSGRT